MSYLLHELKNRYKIIHKMKDYDKKLILNDKNKYKLIHCDKKIILYDKEKIFHDKKSLFHDKINFKTDTN